MKRIKMALKAALFPAIINIIAFFVGIVLFFLGNFMESEILILGGIIGGIIWLFTLIYIVVAVKSRLHAICPECHKFMGDSNEDIDYSYELSQYKENYNKTTREIKYTFYYTCKITCPHCGNTAVFDYTISSNNEAKANVEINKYLKKILKLKK